MDSLSQMTLGAAVGALVGGRKYGRKAALVGAICGSLPDMDVFIPLGDPVSNFTYHRGFSHSLLFCLAATPFLAWSSTKFKFVKTDKKDIRLNAMIFLILLTHIILDALTIYGTQIFWPLSVPPVGIGSIFIIDPLYTIPLLIGLLAYCFSKKLSLNTIGVTLSTLYLVWSLGAQAYIKHIIMEQVSQPSDTVLVQPTPFNTLLWRVLVMEEGRYGVGYISVFDQDKTIKFNHHDNDQAVVTPIEDSFAVSRLKWFTKGFYGVKVEGDAVVMSDLRMGLEPDQYVFQFIVANINNGKVTEIPNQSYRVVRDMARLPKVWDRIWDHDVEF